MSGSGQIALPVWAPGYLSQSLRRTWSCSAPIIILWRGHSAQVHVPQLGSGGCLLCLRTKPSFIWCVYMGGAYVYMMCVCTEGVELPVLSLHLIALRRSLLNLEHSFSADRVASRLRWSFSPALKDLAWESLTRWTKSLHFHGIDNQPREREAESGEACVVGIGCLVYCDVMGVSLGRCSEELKWKG